MQNVSNLVIPEGGVKAIHDKDGNLLWSRIAYDTKYAGDTYQQTYSGKNLFDVNGDFNYGNTNHKTTSSGDGTLTSTANLTSSRSSGQKIEGLVANTTYTLTATIDSYTGTGKPNAGIIQVMNSSGSLSVIKNIQFAVASGIPNTVSGSFTTPADVSAIWVSFNGDTTPGSGVAASATFSQIQIEQGSQPSSYEPYTGGIPAPSPSFPVQINVATGAQTISITDGANTQIFTINLGSTELAKINAYIDYVYPSSGGWYIHNDIGKIASYNGETITTDYMSTTGQLTTGATVYYVLSSPTDTQITDTTLISRLDAVHEWLTRYGYNATVTGNLPIIIDKTNL